MPEPDSRLLHLGHALYHRVMSVFARYRFPGGPHAATRWCTRIGGVPEGSDALVLLTLEELAVNELREPCHHWVRTGALPVRKERLGEPLSHRPPGDWLADEKPGNLDRARGVWDDIESEVKTFAQNTQRTRTRELEARLGAAGKAVSLQAKRSALSGGVRNCRESHRRESGRATAQGGRETSARRRLQLSLFAEIDDELQRRLGDVEAEIVLRRKHYDTVLMRLAAEEKRTLELVLPPRYRLRGEARVYPIAVEIRLPGGSGDDSRPRCLGRAEPGRPAPRAPRARQPAGAGPGPIWACRSASGHTHAGWFGTRGSRHPPPRAIRWGRSSMWCSTMPAGFARAGEKGRP